MSAAPQHDPLAGLLSAMRAFRAGDATARAPRVSDPAASAITVELCTLFNAIADRAQALELEVARRRAWDEDAPAQAESAAARPEASSNAIILEAERAPAILVVEAAPPDDDPMGPMREAAQTALRGLGGAWDHTSVVRVTDEESVHDAVARHLVVSALADSRGPLDRLLTVVAALDETAPGVPLLCFAPDGDPAAFDKATAAARGRTRAEVVRSPAQAVERLTLHWLTQAPVAPDPLAESAESGYGPIRFEGEKVLVVDDDVRNVFAMVSALELYGLTALTADNGPEGIEILQRNPDIGIVLMDLMMPGLDGYATTALIRSHPEFADLPIIAVTARAAPGDRERSLAAGTNEHVTKPVEVDHLLALIKRLIKRG